MANSRSESTEYRLQLKSSEFEETKTESPVVRAGETQNYNHRSSNDAPSLEKAQSPLRIHREQPGDVLLDGVKSLEEKREEDVSLGLEAVVGDGEDEGGGDSEDEGGGDGEEEEGEDSNAGPERREYEDKDEKEKGEESEKTESTLVEEDERKMTDYEGARSEILMPEHEGDDVEEVEEVEEYEYTKEEVKHMKAAFAPYLKLNQKEISINALGPVLRSLGFNPTNEALRSYTKWLDADPIKGIVKFEELLIIVGRQKKVVIDESHVLEAFRFLDVENQGVVQLKKLNELLVNNCEKLDQKEWLTFAALSDPKKTGKVNYGNFVARMGPKPPSPPPDKKKEEKGKKGKKRKKGGKKKANR